MDYLVHVCFPGDEISYASVYQGECDKCCDRHQHKCLCQKLKDQLSFAAAKGFSNADLFCPLRPLSCRQIDKIDAAQCEDEHRQQ